MITAGLPEGRRLIQKIMKGIYKKKRGSLYVSLVPRFKAFALPNQTVRATQKPTPIYAYIYIDTAHTAIKRMYSRVFI